MTIKVRWYILITGQKQKRQPGENEYGLNSVCQRSGNDKEKPGDIQSSDGKKEREVTQRQA